MKRGLSLHEVLRGRGKESPQERSPHILASVAVAPLTAATAVTVALVLHGCGGNNTYNPNLRVRPGVSPTPTASVSPSPSPTPTPTPTPGSGEITISMAPPTASTTVGGSLTFVATVAGTPNTAVTWSVQGGSANGTVNQEGVYTAPGTPGTYTVVATSQADPTQQATATITVTQGSVDGCVPGPVTGPGGLADAPWPTPFGDIRNSSRGRGSGATGVQAWTATPRAPEGVTTGQPTIGANGLVYVFIEDRVYGLDPGTGETRWESAVIGKFGFRSPSPILGANGLMYVDNGLGVFALDIQSGAVRWNTTFQAGTDRILPHLGPDGTVYMLFRGLATNGQYTLKALNGATGEERWSVSNAANSGPLLVGPDGTLYAVNADGSLSAREGRCGTLKWTYTPEPNTFIDTSVTCSLGADGTLYIRAVTNQPFQSRLFAIDTANGTRKWQKELDHGRGVPAIGPDGTLYLLSQDAKLTAHDPATGAERWAFTAPRPQIISQGSPSVAADGTVYFIADKTVYAINGTTGTKAWELTLTESRVEIHGSTPVIGGDGKLYIQDNALPRIYAIR